MVGLGIGSQEPRGRERERERDSLFNCCLPNLPFPFPSANAIQRIIIALYTYINYIEIEYNPTACIVGVTCVLSLPS